MATKNFVSEKRERARAIGNKILKIYIIFTIVLIFLATTNAFAYSIDGEGVCTCDSCSDCMNALNDNTNCNNIVRLNTSIIDHSGTCIDNPANFNNKIFDCQGNTIDGAWWWGYGIYLDGKTNNTIRNCVITEFYYGIYLYSSSHNSLINNTANNNYYGNGISLSYSSNNTLINNTANNNYYGNGISVWYSSHNIIINNTANNNGNGIFLYYSSHNSLINNTANNNRVYYYWYYYHEGYYYGYGISFLYYSSHNTLINNTASDNTHGIYFGSGTDNNTLISNNVCYNLRYDVYVENLNSATGDNNTCAIYYNYNDADSTGCKYLCQVDCNCSTCRECNYELSHPSCSQVNLTANIIDHSGTCIDNPTNFNNKIFDCQGNTIDGVGWWGYGIYLDGKTNNTIRNCVITEFYYGIYLYSSSHNSLINNTANNNYYGNGISVWYSSHNIIINNTGNNNYYGNGIYLYYSSHNSLINNTANNNYDGIALLYSSNNIVTDNVVNDNTNHGINLYSASNNIVTNNSANSNTYDGIALHSSSNNNTITNNTCYNNRRFGISLWHSLSNIITNNTVKKNNNDGIYLGDSDSNNLSNNRIINNNNDGVYFDFYANDNILMENVICFNGGEDVDDDNANLGDNNTCDRTDGWNDLSAATGGCKFSCQQPNITITKTASNYSLPPGGGSVTYYYNVTNTGNVVLTNVTVNDDKCSPVNCPKTTLEPSESMVCNCTTIINKTTTNIANVTAWYLQQMVNATASATVNVLAPSSLCFDPVTTTVKNATIFNITITISGTEIIGASFNLKFDPSILEAVTIYKGSFMSQCKNTTFDYPPYQINNTLGIIEFQTLCISENLTGAGEFAVFEFKAKNNGTSNLTLTDAYVFNASGDPLPEISICDANVTVVLNVPPVAIISSPPNGYITTINTSIVFNETDSYDPDGMIVKYEWDFGDGTTAIGPVTTHNYSMSGIYTVTLTVTDDNGAMNSTTITVNIHIPPVAIITYHTASGQFAYTDQTVHFNGSGSYDPDGFIISWNWTYGDGKSGSGKVVNHTYNTCNITGYNVELMVADNGSAQATANARIIVYLAGDVTHDGKVNIFDLAKFVVAWNSCEGEARYNPKANFNDDKCINILDFAKLVANWKKSC